MQDLYILLSESFILTLLTMGISYFELWAFAKVTYKMHKMGIIK